MQNKEKRFACYRRHQRHHRRRRLVFHFTRELYRFVSDSSGTVAAAPTPATGENKMDRNVRVFRLDDARGTRARLCVQTCQENVQSNDRSAECSNRRILKRMFPTVVGKNGM